MLCVVCSVLFIVFFCLFVFFSFFDSLLMCSVCVLMFGVRCVRLFVVVVSFWCLLFVVRECLLVG